MSNPRSYVKEHYPEAYAAIRADEREHCASFLERMHADTAEGEWKKGWIRGVMDSVYVIRNLGDEE